ncbi:MAG: type II secretion system protein GspE, partial [Rubrivivax sp.]
MRHPLPYAFAKAHHVLLQDDVHQRVLWTGPETSTSALSEVLRVHAVDALQREPSRDLDARIAAAYAGGESSAAAVVGEVESAVDLSRLMQELPAVEDLLEAADDAPIIRMLNALL